MNNSSEPRIRPDLLQAFKDTMARFCQPLPAVMNRLDGFEGLPDRLQPDLPLIGFTPFTRVPAPAEKRSTPLREVTPTGGPQLPSGRDRTDSVRRSGGVSASRRIPAPGRTIRDGGTPDASREDETVPVFKVAPAARRRSGKTSGQAHRGRTGTRPSVWPAALAAREPGGARKAASVVFKATNPRTDDGFQQKSGRPSPKGRPPAAAEPSLASTLENVGRLADELLSGPPETGRYKPVSPEQTRIAEQRMAAAQPAAPAEIKPFSPPPAPEAPVSVRRRTTAGISAGRHARTRSTGPPAGEFAAAVDTRAALTISRIDALSDRLLAGNRDPHRSGRRAWQGSSVLAGDDSDPSRTANTAASFGAGQQNRPKPASTSTADDAPNGPGDGSRHLDQSHRDPEAARDPALTAEQLAEFINDALVDQARRHGVDLS